MQPSRKSDLWLEQLLCLYAQSILDDIRIHGGVHSVLDNRLHFADSIPTIAVLNKLDLVDAQAVNVSALTESLASKLRGDSDTSVSVHTVSCLDQVGVDGLIAAVESMVQARCVQMCAMLI